MIQTQNTNNVVVIGPKSSGKTCLISRLKISKDSIVLPSTIPTIGINFSYQTIPVNSGLINLYIWDTTGDQDRFDLTKLDIQNNYTVIICLDFPELDTFKTYRKYCKNVPTSQIYTVFTHNDRTKGFYHKDVKKQLYKEGYDKIFHTSALTGEGIINLFENIATDVYNREYRIWENSSKRSWILRPFVYVLSLVFRC